MKLGCDTMTTYNLEYCALYYDERDCCGYKKSIFENNSEMIQFFFEMVFQRRFLFYCMFY